MKRIAILLVVAVSAGCAGEPDWRRTETAITEQPYPEPWAEAWVSPPTPYDSLNPQMEKMRAEGWSISDVEPAGREFPGMYIITYRK